jgi:hypothetical protein
MTDTCEFKRVNLNGVRTAGTCPSNIDIGADVGRFDAPATFTVPGGFLASRASGSRFHIGVTTVFIYDALVHCHRQ